MNRNIEDKYFFTLSDSERYLYPSHSVTMHRIAPSFKEEIYSPIIKNVGKPIFRTHHKTIKNEFRRYFDKKRYNAKQIGEAIGADDTPAAAL